MFQKSAQFSVNTNLTKILISAVISRDDDSVSAADMGLALTYAQTITQILNFLIRVTAELEVNVRYDTIRHILVSRDWSHDLRKSRYHVIMSFVTSRFTN